MKIVITGGTGFLGRHLSNYFRALGHEIKLIQRSDIKDGANRISKLIKSTDVLINLAGSPVIKRWTTANREEIMSSRLKTTNILVETLKGMKESERPSIFLSASAIGIYDSKKVHTELSVNFDDNFLSTVCKRWEQCLQPLRELNIRLCVMRIGIVLGNDGGMLKRLIPIFKAGLGGKIGTGSQGFSFIHYHDFCRVVGFLADNSKCHGIFNLTAPEFSTNVIFTRILARECHRPAFFTIPETGLKLIYGKAAVAMLKGQSVYPQHLLDCGFRFQYPNVESAIHSLLSRQIAP
jgi:uncharacterized protein (TIGR01777 family)